MCHDALFEKMVISFLAPYFKPLEKFFREFRRFFFPDFEDHMALPEKGSRDIDKFTPLKERQYATTYNQLEELFDATLNELHDPSSIPDTFKDEPRPHPDTDINASSSTKRASKSNTSGIEC